jgi:hypothetical protein
MACPHDSPAHQAFTATSLAMQLMAELIQKRVMMASFDGSMGWLNGIEAVVIEISKIRLLLSRIVNRTLTENELIAII